MTATSRLIAAAVSVAFGPAALCNTYTWILADPRSHWCGADVVAEVEILELLPVTGSHVRVVTALKGTQVGTEFCITSQGGFEVGKRFLVFLGRRQEHVGYYSPTTEQRAKLEATCERWFMLVAGACALEPCDFGEPARPLSKGFYRVDQKEGLLLPPLLAWQPVDGEPDAVMVSRDDLLEYLRWPAPCADENLFDPSWLPGS